MDSTSPSAARHARRTIDCSRGELSFKAAFTLVETGLDAAPDASSRRARGSGSPP